MEIKFFDKLYNIGVDNSDSTPFVICNPTQGTTDSQRIGDKIKALTFRSITTVKRNGSNATGIRMILINDKSNTISNLSGVLSPSTIGGVNVINSDYNVDNRREYQVLLDVFWNISADFKEDNRKRLIRKLNKIVSFQAGGATIDTNELKFFVCSDIASGAAAKPLFQSYQRVYYGDA